ncbi:hypothetical protein P9314_16080 [Paenibacillus validus]|uniref:Uncharacterized protein n=1 Tax=Paenibacillus validus TaxID=44253 RepID=A0A7X2Z8F2_9BACL|nr:MULTISPECIES: hypothetical protein [Paenibacillus]MED4602205.1 hypothetical protein [Paenibacillus validus]MED4607371.1 hypothetical protein [Paenibacillus validus]MUG70245.1 hypothetical protein [Paenibacillus validus]
MSDVLRRKRGRLLTSLLAFALMLAIVPPSRDGRCRKAGSEQDASA